jgi:hypothetical protein
MPLPTPIVDTIRSWQHRHILATAQRDMAIRALKFIARHQLTPGFNAREYANQILRTLKHQEG